MSEPDAPKLIIDSDWKSQAQAEKEKLAAKEAQAPKPRAAGPGGMEDDLPSASFEELVRMLATQALMYMGAFPDQTGRAMIALDLAKLHIDLLGVLEEKTKNNLSEPEKTMLSKVGHELRLQFVEIGHAIDRAVVEGKISPQGGVMGGPGVIGKPGAGAPGVVPKISIPRP